MHSSQKTERELLRELEKLKDHLAQAQSSEKELEQALQRIRQECDHCWASLKHCEETNRLLFETAHDAIFIQDGDLFIDCNSKALKLFGCTERAELIGHSPVELSPEFQPDGADSATKAQAYIYSALQNKPQTFYWRARRKDGAPLDLEVSLNAFTLGEKRQLQGIVRDVSVQLSEHKQAIGELNFLQTLIDTIPSAIFFKDIKGVYQGCNQAFKAFLGLSKDEIVGKTLHEVFPKDLADKYLQMDKELFRNPGQQVYEWQISSVDGERHDVIFNKATYFDQDGAVAGMVGIITDITAHKQAKQALQASEDKYRDIVENAVEGIFQCTPDGRFISINSAMAHMHGYSSPREMMDVITNIGEQLFSDFPKWECFRAQIDMHGVIRDYEVRTRCKDGTVIWVLINARKVLTGNATEYYMEGFIEDITKRKDGDLALRRYEVLSENTREIILFVGLDGKILEANQAAVQAYGYDRETLLSLTLFNLRAPHLLEGLRKDLKRTDEKNIFIETEHIRKDGTIFPVEVSAGPVVIGNEKMYFSIVRDITERKKAGQALQASEEKYRNIFENAVEGIFQSAPDGRVLSVNPAHAHIFGYASPQEFIDSFPDIAYGHYVHPEDRAKFKEICDSQGFIRNYEVEFYNKNREIIWISLNARVVCDTEGHVLYYEGFAEDITQRKKTEKALQDSQRLFAEIIDFLPDATFVVDTSGTILIWNRAMEEMTNCKAENMVGKGNYEYALAFYGERKPMLVDLLSHPDAELESRYTAFERETDSLIAEGERDIRGVPRSLQAKAALLYDSQGNVSGAIESLRDITQRKRMEEELRKREQELEIKTRGLEEINVALKVLLNQRDKDRDDLEKNIILNMQKMVSPYIERLKFRPLDPTEAAYVRILEMSLNDITSPFINKLSAKLTTLTPREVEVAKLVKDGKSTKEIADLLNSTIRAVEFHRDNIRRKLGLSRSNKNLRSYLLSLV